MNDNTGRIAIAALLVAIGAKDHEMEPTVKILNASPVPESYPKLVQAARDALALVRIEAAS